MGISFNASNETFFLVVNKMVSTMVSKIKPEISSQELLFKVCGKDIFKYRVSHET